MGLLKSQTLNQNQVWIILKAIYFLLQTNMQISVILLLECSFKLLFLKQISRSLSWPYSFLPYFFINKHSQANLCWVQNRFELWKSKTGTMLICNTCWLCFQGKHSQGFIAILFFKQTWSDCQNIANMSWQISQP